MIDIFKDTANNKNTLDHILQNHSDYKILAKSAYKKHASNIENDIKHIPYKFDPILSTPFQKVFFPTSMGGDPIPSFKRVTPF